MRHTTPLALALAVTLSCAPLAVAQEDSRPSFAQRLASLRLGWGDSEEEREDPREAIEASAQSRRAGSVASREEPRTGFAARLPRLNPGDLLPGDMFSGTNSESAPRRRPTAAHLRHNSYHRSTTAESGSARSRIIRDLRVQTSGETNAPPRVASREPNHSSAAQAPPASQPSEPSGARLAPRPQVQVSRTMAGRGAPVRVGSVLSDPPAAREDPAAVEPPTVAQAPIIHEADLRRELLGPTYLGGGAKQDRADDATARSIAAAVASSMASESTAAATEPAATEAVGVEDLLVKQTEEALPQPADEAAESQTQATEVVAEAAPAESEAAAATSDDRYAATSLPVIPITPAIEPVAEPNEPVAPSSESAPPAAAAAESDWRDAGENEQLNVEDFPPPAAEEVVSQPPAPTESAPQDGFEQEVARRRFDDSVEQSIQPRTAEPLPSWNVTTKTAPPAAAEAADRNADADLLMSQRMPQIVSRVSGPKQIVIGREAVYRVLIANRGDESADQLAATITVPEWAEVVGSRSSVGLVEPPVTESGATRVLWRMAELPPGKTQRLDLKLIARQGRPIELGVNWKHAPVGSRTVVEVQEPKLALSLEGPDEVLCGKPRLFRLHVSNPGTGPAEDVRVRVVPPGPSMGGAGVHNLGALLPNESRTIEFNVTGGEAGEMKIQAQAAALGDLAEQTSKSIFCRKPELEVDWRGPARKYAGAAATYYFRVRNPGTAAAEGVEFRVNLPTGFEVTKASGNGQADSTGRQMRWSVGTLRPGDDYYMELQGVINQPGANEFALGAADSDRLAASTATATTEVIALADLKLEIRDPKGPLPVGREAVYEVRVRNRGTSAARKVQIVGLFSQGIEPYKVEGAQCSIADGRVAIRMVDSLTVGSELVLMIHAKATKPGAHIFRAEVLCQDLDIKLAAEETTRFYAEERIDLGEGAARAAGMADRFSAPR